MLFRRIAVLLTLGLVFAAAAWSQEAKAAPKVAVIDLMRVLHESASGKALMARLEEENARKGREIRAMEADLMSLEERIRGADQRGLSPDKVAELKKQYEVGIREYQQKGQSAERDMADLRENQFKQIEDRIRPILEQLTKEMGLDLIFDRPQSGIIYSNRSMDITDVVLQRFTAAEAAAAPAASKAPATGKK